MISPKHLSVDIICVEDDQASLALRSVLEYWAIWVTLYFIPTSKELVSLLSDGEHLSQYIVLMAHGEGDKGLILPALGAEIEKTVPYKNYISATQMASFMNLPHKTVISTACKMGTSEFVKAFLESGCHGYIACNGYPEGSSSLFYIIQLFYNLLNEASSLKEAHRKASHYDEECHVFQLFESSKRKREQLNF